MRSAVLIFFITSLSGITFERTYGRAGFDDWAEAVLPDQDGGYIIGGTTTTDTVGYYYCYPIKTDAWGDTIWSSWQYRIKGLVRDMISIDSGYLLLASNFFYGDYDFELLWYDTAGTCLWRRHYGGDKNEVPYALIRAHDGNYIAVGRTDSLVGFGDEVWVIKVAASDSLLWSRSYPAGEKDEVGYDLTLAGDGYLIVGYTNSFGAGGRDLLLIRTDSVGDSLWMRTYGGVDDDIGMAVRSTPDGGFIIAGATHSYGAGDYDVYLLKIDASGDTVWTRTFGGPDWDGAFGLCLSADSCYVIVGETRSYSFGLSDLYLLKVDRDGNLIWQKTYGFADEDRGYDVRLALDGGFIISGATRGEHGHDWDIYLLKTDRDGNIGIAEEEGSGLNLVKIYPNPSHGRVSLDLRSDVSQIILFDASGRMVHRLSPSPHLQLTLPPGVYFLKIKTPSDIKTEKLVVVR